MANSEVPMPPDYNCYINEDMSKADSHTLAAIHNCRHRKIRPSVYGESTSYGCRHPKVRMGIYTYQEFCAIIDFFINKQ